jgi:hypothetical protein
VQTQYLILGILTLWISLYTQNHVIDAALGAPAAKPNENHPWLVGRDDVTECVFRDGRQMWDYFGSEHVKDVVAKDIPFFADVGGLCWLVSARDTSVFDADPAGGSLGDGQDAGFVGFYFLASPPSPVAQLPHEASSLIAKTFQTHAGAEIIHGELYKVLPEYDLSGYFGKGNEGIPKFAAVVKLFLKGRGSIATVRQAQSIIENNPTIGNSVDLGRSFIVFTNRMLVFAEHKVCRLI